MESIVAQALASYFKLIIKNFSKDQFNLSVLKGTAQLLKLDLNECFIQELLMIPTTLEVVSAKCNHLFVDVPNLRKITTKPIVLILDQVDLSLQEPEIVKPMPMSQVEIKNGKRKIPNHIIRDMKVIVNHISVKVKLLAKNQTFIPEFWIDINNLILETTDMNFKVVDLNDARVKTSHYEKTFKHITCSSITVNMVSNQKTVSTIVKEIPFNVKVSLLLDTNTNEYLTATIDAYLNDVKVSFDEISWQYLVTLLMALKSCLERDIPPTVIPWNICLAANNKKKNFEIPPAYEIDTSYRLSINKWEIELNETEKMKNGKKKGFLCFGDNFQFYISPKAKVDKINPFDQLSNSPKSTINTPKTPILSKNTAPQSAKIAPKEIKNNRSPLSLLKNSPKPSVLSSSLSTPANSLQKKELYESTLKIRIQSFTLSTLESLSPNHDNEDEASFVNNNNNNIEANDQKLNTKNGCEFTNYSKYNLIQQCNMEKKCFIFININHKWTSLTDPHSTHFTVKFHGLNVCLNRFNWGDLYNFLIANVHFTAPHQKPVEKVDEAALEQEAKQDVEKVLDVIEKIKQVKIGDYLKWYKKSKVRIDIQNSKLIFPNDASSVNELDRLNHSMVIVVDDISFINKPEWSFVPEMEQYFQGNPATKYLTSSHTERGSKFQMDLFGIHIDTYDNINKTRTPVLDPSNFCIYGRFHNKTEGGEIELKFKATSCCFAINAIQERYLAHFVTVHQQFISNLRFSSTPQEEEELATLLDQKKKYAFSTATQLIQNERFQPLSILTNFFQSYQIIVNLWAEKGSLSFSIDYGTEYEKEMADDCATTTTTTLLFEELNIMMENSAAKGQSLLMSLRSIKVEGITHPLSPFSLSLLPYIPNDDNDDEERNNNNRKNLRIFYQTRNPRNKKPFAEADIRLQYIQFVSQAKKGAIRSMGKGFEIILPYLKQLFSKVSGFFVDLKDKDVIDDSKLESIKESLAQGADYVDKALDRIRCTWELIISNCRVMLLDSNWEERKEELGAKPFGSVLITSFAKQFYLNRINEAVKEISDTYMRIQDSEESCIVNSREKVELAKEVKSLEIQLQSETQKLKDEIDDLEKQYLRYQSAFAELQLENESLKQLFTSQNNGDTASDSNNTNPATECAIFNSQ